MKTYLFPGQGSQRAGMGEALFDEFAEITTKADAILGCSIKDLCLHDRQDQLGQTQFTQPALYVVNALTWRKRAAETGERPDFVAGHSVGEYNALECAGVFGFEDGLRLVCKRGALMATAPKGAMAAVIGLTADRIAEILAQAGLSAIDMANFNAPTQIIISGLEDDIRAAQPVFEKHQGMYIPLNVSGAFHSRYMAPVLPEFAAFLDDFSFAEPTVPVIANVTATPYRPGTTAEMLKTQLTSPVRWLDSMHYLLQQGVQDFLELGPGNVLTNMMKSIRSQHKSAPAPAPAPTPTTARNSDPRQMVADWNNTHRIGIKVRVKGYPEPLTTRTEAMILFGHRAAIYMQDYNGYFALDEVEPTAPA